MAQLINQTPFTALQYFKIGICQHQNSTLNNIFARGFDINTYKNYQPGYGDHDKIILKELLENHKYTSINEQIIKGLEQLFDGYRTWARKFFRCNYQKVIVKTLLDGDMKYAQKEVSILQKIDSIKNIPHLHGIAKDGEDIFLIFEYAPGDTLEEQINMKELSLQDVKYYAYLLLEVIGESHKLGIVHRDIKPHNIIINNEKRNLKLIDWGLSDVYFPYDMSSSNIGTKRYKAPELQLQVDYKVHFSFGVDVWAAGICILEMMLGRQPLINGESSYTAMMSIIGMFGYKDILKLSSWLGIDLNIEVHQTISQMKSKYASKGIQLEQLFKIENKEEAIDELGIDLLNQMLKIIPSERISIEEALKHPYFDSVREEIASKKMDQFDNSVYKKNEQIII